MTIKEYLEKLNSLKKLAVSRWGNLTTIEKTIIDGSFEWLVDNLEIKRGEIKVDEDLSRVMDEFLSAVVDTINRIPLYQSNIKKFLQDLTTIQTNNKLFHATTNKFNIETAGVTDIQKAVVTEIIDQYTGNGLNVNFAAPLKDGIFRNILAGANMRDVKQVLQAYILSNQDKSGKLASYIDQTAMQAVDSYTGAINQQLVKEFDFTGYIISGSLIETSSKQCIYAVETADQQFGYLPFDEWEKVLDIARNNPRAKLIPGTTLKNLPLNKLHWGCRHDFTPVIMGPVKKKEKEEEPVKPEPKQEPKPQPKPQKKKGSPYRVAKNMIDANKVTKDIFETNTNLKVQQVSGSSTDTLERRNKLNRILNDLTTEYNLSPEAAKGQEVKLSFKSSPTRYGQVTSSYKGQLLKINFGDKWDGSRSLALNTEISFLRNKSRASEEDVDVSTAVHEFGHVLTLQSQAGAMATDEKFKGFWPELLGLRKEYHDELKAINEKNNSAEEYAKVFLGRYASTNANEFIAEAFTEYRLSRNPSKYAKKVGLLIDKYFKK